MDYLTLFAVIVFAVIYYSAKETHNPLRSAKRSFDRAYERMMRELHSFENFWREVWQPEYDAQPFKLESKE